MKKKIITLVLAALSALSLAACRTGGNTPAGSTGTVGTKDTDGDVTYDANNILDKFDEKDFGGKDFRIYCANYFNDAVFVRQAPTEDADPADRINAALYKRDSQLEEKYKVKMVYTIATNDQVLADTAKELASTGEDAMDLLLGSLFYLGSGSGMLSDNLLTDIGEIKEIDLSNDWWNRNMTESFTLGGKTFFSTGDITTRGTTSVSLILFNKKLLEDEKTSCPIRRSTTEHGLTKSSIRSTAERAWILTRTAPYHLRTTRSASLPEAIPPISGAAEDTPSERATAALPAFTTPRRT